MSETWSRLRVPGCSLSPAVGFGGVGVAPVASVCELRGQGRERAGGGGAVLRPSMLRVFYSNVDVFKESKRSELLARATEEKFDFFLLVESFPKCRFSESYFHPFRSLVIPYSIILVNRV